MRNQLASEQQELNQAAQEAAAAIVKFERLVFAQRRGGKGFRHRPA
jgi:hypothetical protein